MIFVIYSFQIFCGELFRATTHSGSENLKTPGQETREIKKNQFHEIIFEYFP